MSLSWSHLTSGQRAGLKEHQVSERMFDAMSEDMKRSWISELKNDLHGAMRNFHKKDQSGLRELLTIKQ